MSGIVLSSEERRVTDGSVLVKVWLQEREQGQLVESRHKASIKRDTHAILAPSLAGKRLSISNEPISPRMTDALIVRPFSRKGVTNHALSREDA